MAITAAQVKELRERTGAGMMECKKVLTATNGDIEAAIDELRKSGQAKAAKKAGRVAAEGVIVMQASADGKSGFMAEINSETDFVARDENFLAFANMVATRGMEEGVETIDALSVLPAEKGQSNTIEQMRESLVQKIGENIQVRRVGKLATSGCVGLYLHGARIGVMVAIDQDDEELARDVAMHIAATNPQAINEDDLPASIVEREREIFISQARESGKPDDIIEKMIVGRMNKFVKEVCLLGQPFIKNPDQTVAQLLKEKNAQVLAFERFEVGEGIEKETVDFAEEVRAQVEGG